MLSEHLLNGRTDLEFISGRDRGRYATVLGKYIFSLDPGDHLSECLARDGYWESWITAIMAQVLKPGMCCMDIGCNQGYYTALMCDAVGKAGGGVIAVDPNPQPLWFLRETMRLNRFTNYSEICAAITDKVGEFVTFSSPEHDTMNGSHIRTLGKWVSRVRTETIDSLVDSYFDGVLDLIKIDTEGAEPLVWRGMQQTIKNNPQLIIFLEFEAARYPDPEQFLAEIANEYPLRAITGEGIPIDTTAEQLLAKTDWEMIYLCK